MFVTNNIIYNVEEGRMRKHIINDFTTLSDNRFVYAGPLAETEVG